MDRRAVRMSARSDRLASGLPDEVKQQLRPIERLHLEVALRMNREPMKAFWTLCQRYIGAFAVRLLTRNLVTVRGFEHVEASFRRGAILFVANHRTYFDLFVVASLVHRRLPGRKRLFFPVLGQYYYQSVVGMVLNQAAAFWSMFPPLFALPSHAASDRYALEILADLCARGAGHVLGIHPEGGRNLDPDPYSYLRFQPGAGRIIHVARPIVIPVFITGMDTNVREQVRRNWRGGEPVRVWFGTPVDLDEHYALPPKGSTYKRIVDAVMDRVKALGEEDRGVYGKKVESRK
jgi:1-acyl-sn-glycerol-3-phosphate acyltransferase